MSYTGMNQTAVVLNAPKAISGMRADTGVKDTLARVCKTAAIKPGRAVVGNLTECEPPDAASDFPASFLGFSLYSPIKEPLSAGDGTQYAIGQAVPVERMGRCWGAVKTGTPAANDPVYVYVGATAADRGMVSNAAAASYVRLPGAKFTGNLETVGEDCAEIQLNDAVTAGADLISEQAISGTLVAGTCTIATGIRVTAASRAEVTPSADITGTTNFGCLAHIVASNVAGEAGTGSIVIRALTNAGVLDADAAGTFHGTLKG